MSIRLGQAHGSHVKTIGGPGKANHCRNGRQCVAIAAAVGRYPGTAASDHGTPNAWACCRNRTGTGNYICFRFQRM
jgi:hypothetical protein